MLCEDRPVTDAIDASPTAVHLFGVEYELHRDAAGAELYLTPFGRHLRRWINPSQWLVDGRVPPQAQRLTAGTGSVFRVPVPYGHRQLDLVVKFSRMAQHMPVGVVGTMPEGVASVLIDKARFNSPFEEFGLVMALRRSTRGPADLRLYTKRPLAIYCPPRHYAAWQLGRSDNEIRRHDDNLRQHQDPGADHVHVHLHKDRDYIMVYAWVRGFDAHELNDLGYLNDEQTEAVTRRAADELLQKGYRILDHKPRHVILRVRRDGSLLRRRGKFVYALIDFELLEEVNGSA